MHAKVSVLWVNYNSMHVIELTKKSLSAVFQIDYPDFEVILVDNGSSDGSAEAIAHFLEDKWIRQQFKFIRLKRNFGWTGAINAGYRARNRNSKYVSLTHNDLLLLPDYLKNCVHFLEEHGDVGAVQGIVTKLDDHSVVDSAGFMLNEDLAGTALSNYRKLTVSQDYVPVSCVEGTMPIYNIDAVSSVLGDDNALYVECAFIYYLEDVFLSLMLWHHGYASALLPSITGEHYRKATIDKALSSLDIHFYLTRNRIALLLMTNSRDKARFIAQILRRIMLSRSSLIQRKFNIDSLVGGIRLGKRLRERYGTVNLYAAPVIALPLRSRLRF